jgi:hypothetical protein
MGHIRLEKLAATKKWRWVVSLLSGAPPLIRLLALPQKLQNGATASASIALPVSDWFDIAAPEGLGRLLEARAEVGKMLKLNPAITLQTWRLGYSFRDPGILDRYALDLVQAGLPETNSVDGPFSGIPPSKDSQPR